MVRENEGTFQLLPFPCAFVEYFISLRKGLVRKLVDSIWLTLSDSETFCNEKVKNI